MRLHGDCGNSSSAPREAAGVCYTERNYISNSNRTWDDPAELLHNKTIKFHIDSSPRNKNMNQC